MPASSFGVPKEMRRDVAHGFILFFGLLTAHSLLETTRDTLLLANRPASVLPLIYLAIAVVAVVAVRLNQRALDRFPSRRLLGGTLVGAGAITSVFWLLLDGENIAAIYALYIWTGLVATLAVAQLWILLGSHFDVAQAKRAFAVISSGGLIGATVGSASAGALLEFLSPHHLTAVAAVILALTGGCAVAFPSAGETEEARRRRGGDEAANLRNAYLVRLLIVIGLTTITVTAGDLLFKTVIKAEVPTEQLGQFFALFYTGLNGISLVVQLVVASWLLRFLGVGRALWVLPALVLCSAVGFAMTAAMLPALLLRVFDGSLRHSLNKTGVELLYLPLPSRQRAKHKLLIDALGTRGGQAVASLLVLGAFAMNVGPRGLAVGVAVLAAVWLVSVANIRHYYVALFRAQLRDGTIETRVDVPALDLHSLEALISALSSSDEVVVINALDLLEASGRASLIPALILYHPSPDVVIRALEVFSDTERTDFAPVARRLMQSIDPDVRGAALGALSQMEDVADILRQSLDDVSPSVRAIALVALVARGDCSKGEMVAQLNEIMASSEAEPRLALARAIRRRPGPEFVPVLEALATTGDPDLRAEIARAMAAAPEPAYLKSLLPMLADRRARPDARAAMLALDSTALKFLDQALSDCSLPRRIRLHLPRTISRFGDEEAASILLEHLAREKDTNVGYKILRGLGRLVEENPLVRLDRREVERLAHAMLRRSVQLLTWRMAVERAQEQAEQSSVGAELLVALLREKEASAVERTFRMLGLLNPEEHFGVLYAGLFSDNPKKRASSREVLEYVLRPPLRAGLLTLVEYDDPARRLAALPDSLRPAEKRLVAHLQEMLHDNVDAVSCFAAHYIGELGLAEFRDELCELSSNRGGIMAEVFENAVRLLTAPAGAAHAP